MGQTPVTRKEFLDATAVAGAGVLLSMAGTAPPGTCGGCSQGSVSGDAPCGTAVSAVRLRPYQLLCLVCSMGDAPEPKDPKLKELLGRIRRDPETPLSLCCNAGDVYVYQDPGTADDTPEGRDYNRKRDLDVLQRLDAPPGATHPARIWLAMLLKRIPSVAGLCGYPAVTSEAWKGCARAGSGSYEQARAKGVNALIPPRDDAEMARDKEASIKALQAAKEVPVRPHILVCSVCQYGGGTRPPFKPDNLPELVQLVLSDRSDFSIKLVRGADWMMCAPCPSRVVGMNACVCGPIHTGGLYNELKDLNVLQRLGLTFGTTMKARALYRLILEKIPSVAGVCALENQDKARESVWWDPCGADKHPAYEKGRKELLEKLRG